MKNKTPASILRRIETIKSKLAEIGDMRPGSLTIQFKDPKNKEGAYYQLSYTLDMKSRTDYIRKEHVNTIRKEIENYKKYKTLNEELVKLNIERSKVKMRTN